MLSHGHLFSLQFWPIHTNSQLGWSFLCPSGWKNWTDSSDKEESQVLIIIRWILPSASALFLHFSALTKTLNLLLVIPLHGIAHHSTSLNMAKKILNIKNRQEKVNIHWRKYFFICFFMICNRKFCNECSYLSLVIVLIAFIALLALHFSITVKSAVLSLKQDQTFCRSQVSYLH